MGNHVCSREDKSDIHDKNNGTPTKNVDTKTKETRIIVKETSEIKEQTAKTVNNQVRTKTENVGARAKEAGNKVKRTQQPKGASEIDVLQVEPKSELKFKGPFNKKVAAPMTLKNTSTSESICFKVKATALRQYCVRPNRGIIYPQETVSVQVLLQPRVYDPNMNCKEKMRVDSFVVSLKEAKASNIDKLWQSADKDRLNMVKLNCVFEVPVISSLNQNGTSEAFADEKTCARPKVGGNDFELPDCEPCKTYGMAIEATEYCQGCKTFVCDSCKSCHNKFACLRQHLFVPANEHIDHPVCGPCNTEGTKANATEYCQDCKMFICDYCKSCHNRFESLRLHSFVQANESIRVNSFKEKNENVSKCDCKNHKVEKYCENHEAFICMTCTDAKHGECQDCKNIDEEWYNYQTNIDEMVLKVKTLESEIQNLKYDCNFDAILEKGRIREEVEKFKADLDEWIENLETNVLNEVEALAMSNNTIDLMLKRMLKIANNDAELLKDNTDDRVKTLKLTNKLSRSMKDCEQILLDLKAGSVPRLVFERNEKLKSMVRDINAIGHVRLLPTSLINI